jgi:hypothetical protein
LDLGGGEPGLYLIYGTNEAGKSTALRAITGLLYGIPRLSGDDHVHKKRDLRIGATLINDDGARLEVVRRKGQKSTLLSPSGEALGDGVLGLTFLYGTAFTIMFTVLPKLGVVGNSAIMNIEPIFALVLAWAILGQTIAPVQVAGGLVVVATVMWLGLRKG